MITITCTTCPAVFEVTNMRGPRRKRCDACRAKHDRVNNWRDVQRYRTKNPPPKKTTKKRGPIGYAGKYNANARKDHYN